MQMDHLPSHEMEAPIPIRSSFVVGVGRGGFGGGGGSYPTNHHHVVHHPAGATATVTAAGPVISPTIPKEERPSDSPSPSSPPPPQHTLPLLNASGPPSPPPTAVNATPSGTHVTNKSGALESSSYVYRECLRNHAASLGGNATDGCGEFMPGGSDGASSGDALMCSACGCHRNFHRKELTGDGGLGSHRYSTSIGRDGAYYPQQYLMGRKVVGQKGVLISTAACTALVPYRQPPQLQHHPQPAPTAMVLPLHAAPALETDHEMDQADSVSPGVLGRTFPANATAPFSPVVGVPPGFAKKRFRTKFTPEQKKRMLGFAERMGWRLQRREEAEVQRFCHEIGVKRRVLKVWMHNNKHHRRNAGGVTGAGIFPNVASSSNGAGSAESGDHHHDSNGNGDESGDPHHEGNGVVHHDAPRGHDDNGHDLDQSSHRYGFAAATLPQSHPQALQHLHQHPASSGVIQVED